MSTTEYRYMGTVPGAVSTDFTLFDTTAGNQFPANFFPMCGVSHFKLKLRHVAVGTLTWSRSSDRGRIWQKEGSDLCNAPVAPSYFTEKDFLVEGAKDWKLVWTNGGTAQQAHLHGNADITAAPYPIAAGLTLQIDCAGSQYCIVFPALANAAALVAAIDSQVGATNITATVEGGTGHLDIVDDGLGSESSLLVTPGTATLAVLGLVAPLNQNVGWLVEMQPTTSRNKIM